MELEHPEDEKPRKKKKPGSARVRNEFKLPAGFTVITKRTKKKTWKEPDGNAKLDRKMALFIKTIQERNIAR